MHPLPPLLHSIRGGGSGPVGGASASLHFLTVHDWRTICRNRAVTVVEVDVYEIEGVDVSREEAQDGEEDVDEEVGAAAGHEKDSQRGDYMCQQV